MVVASRVRVQLSARAMPMRFTGLGHAGRGQCHAEARRDGAGPLSMGMASGAGVARYDTRFRPTRLESCGSERGSPLVIGSDTRQPRLAALAALIDRRSACSAAAVPDLVSRTCAEARSSISNEP